MEETVEKLKNLAVKEDWDTIDGLIPSVCNQPAVFGWAYDTGIYEENDHVRDLAASLLEKAKWPTDRAELIKEKVLSRLRVEQASYAKFRLACALFNHDYHLPEAIEVLENAPDDVQDIAKNYLTRT